MIKKTDEQILINKLKAGDQQAAKAWFLIYKSRLLNLVLKKVSIREDAEEIVQETFINCLKGLNLFRGQASLFSWMQSILRHEIADYYRKRYAKKAIRTLPLGDFLLNHTVVNAHESSIRVKKVLAKMLKEKRELLLLKYVDRLAVKEIANLLGKTIKAVESDLFRARREFRELYLNLELNQE